MCSKNRELFNITLNLDVSIETARAGVEQLCDDLPIDRLMVAAAFESFVNAVENQNTRLRKLVR